MKRKRTDWARVAWTPFEECALPTSADAVRRVDPPTHVLRNSRYQVLVYVREPVAPFGAYVHLSIKTHDKQAHHDWRDLQRIKNEVCGPEHDAVEVYPAESKLVDSANQYHLFVFESFRLPFGFHERLVGDGTWEQSVQRPFPRGERPADCLSPAEYQSRVDAALARLADSTTTDRTEKD